MQKNDFVNEVVDTMKWQFDKERWISKRDISKKITEYVRKYFNGSYKKMNIWVEAGVEPGFSKPVEALTYFCME